MEYKDMNIYDIASILQNLFFDEDMDFKLMFNGHEFPIYKQEVVSGGINLIVDTNCPSCKLEDDEEKYRDGFNDALLLIRKAHEFSSFKLAEAGLEEHILNSEPIKSNLEKIKGIMGDIPC